MIGVSTAQTRPFLRWAGGKSWLLKELSSNILSNLSYGRYFEPFLGGAAVFFGLISCNEVYLSDSNEELITTYLQVRDNVENVIARLRTYENNEDFYYFIRKKAFKDPADRAARFIYLNQTSYNGLYRVNMLGEYNVPYGHRSKPFLDENGLRAASKRLTKANILACDFSSHTASITKGDLVFLDPPYVVSHNNNGFIKYNKKLFSMQDQERLSMFVDRIKSVGAYYVMTNAAHPEIARIFHKGDRLIGLSRASLIGGQHAKRGSVAEYLFTNIGEGESHG